MLAGRADANRHDAASAIASGSASTTTGAALSRARPSRVLEAVPGQDADDARAGLDARLDERGQPGCGGRLAENTFLAGEVAPGLEDRLVGERHDAATRLAHSLSGLLGVRRIRDANRRRERRPPLRSLAGDERRPARSRLREATRIGTDVAPAAVREREHVRCASEVLDDLERGRLLPFDAKRVERVDEDVRAAVGERARGRERVVEAPADLDDARSERAGLRDLRGGDRSMGLENDGLQPRTGRIRSSGGRGVSGRGADHRRDAGLERLRDRERHPAILEAPGRVRSLPLEVQLDAESLGQARRTKERRRALSERHDRRRLIDGKAVAISIDDAGH